MDRSLDLLRQLERVFPDARIGVYFERSIDRVLERFESEAFDVLILTSPAAKGGDISGIELLEVITEKSPATHIIFLINPKGNRPGRFGFARRRLSLRQTPDKR